MAQLIRGRAHRAEEHKVAADVLFGLLADWPAVLDWFPSDEGGIAFQDVELIGVPDTLPFARKLYRPNGGPIVETLILCDARARRATYTINDGSLPGVVNYVATNTVDEIDRNRCIFTLESAFDVTDPSLDAEQASQMIVGFYGMIQRGFRDYFAQRDTRS